MTSRNTGQNQIRGNSRTSGFTLVEIMISIAIFTMVSGAMVAILIAATQIFQGGEAARAANDEAVAVLSTIEDDLRRAVPQAPPVIDATGQAVPAQIGGWVYAKVLDDGTGNCLLAWVIANPDRTEIDTATGAGARLLVAYGVESDRKLRRKTWRLGANGSVDVSFREAVRTGGNPSPYKTEEIASDCLHFSAWIAVQDVEAMKRPFRDRSGIEERGCPEWEKVDTDKKTILPPRYDASAGTPPRAFDTAMLNNAVSDPFPNAVRIAVTLTGGNRFATRGSVLSSTTDGTVTRFRVKMDSGRPGLGALIRIDQEWMKVTKVDGSFLSVDKDDRSKRRSRVDSALDNLAAGSSKPLWAGQTYSVVRAFPR